MEKEHGLGVVFLIFTPIGIIYLVLGQMVNIK